MQKIIFNLSRLANKIQILNERKIVKMKESIIKLLGKYEDLIMQNTLGYIVDEDGERYAKIYGYEWRDHKHDIAYTLEQIIQYGIKVNPTGLAYIIITEWCGVMTFDDGDLNIDGLEMVCEKILAELK
jgi:hypothetical protein